MSKWQSKYTDLYGLYMSVAQERQATIIPERFNQAVVDQAVNLTEWTVWKRGYHLHGLGLSLRDVAYDAVAELLSDENEHTHYPLHQSLSAAVGQVRKTDKASVHLRIVLMCYDVYGARSVISQ